MQSKNELALRHELAIERIRLLDAQKMIMNYELQAIEFELQNYPADDSTPTPTP